MATPLDTDEPLGIGAILSQARKRQHIDITTVEEQTKIRSKYLRALEDEDWDVLPAPAYARGFIRAYADLLGLDAEVLVDVYRRRHEEPPTTTTYELPEPLLRGRTPEEGPRGPRPWVIAGAALVAGIIAVLLVVGLTGGGDEEGKGGAGKGKRNEQGRQQKKGKRENAKAGSPTTDTNEAPTTATVKLVARSDVQACLVDEAGDVLVPNQLLTAGTEDGPYVSKSFKVELNPGAAQIMLNGKEARTPPSPEPVAYKVTPEGVKDIKYTGKLCP